MTHVFFGRRYAPIAPARIVPPAHDPREADATLLEGLARVLEEHSGYKVLRRLADPVFAPPFPIPNTRLALAVDLETTGPDPATDDVIEFAAMPFRFADSGRIVCVYQPFVQLRRKRQVSPLHCNGGPSDDLVVAEGALDGPALAPMLQGVELVVAHNASHDRPFAERLYPPFRHMDWACSLTDLPWGAERIAARNLPVIAAAYGFFYDCHHAVDDCRALVEILGSPLPKSRRSGMAELVRRATRESFRVWALGAPYEARNVLRRRNYRWSDGTGGGHRAWFTNVEHGELAREINFLRSQVFAGRKADIPVTRITARDRFSERV